MKFSLSKYRFVLSDLLARDRSPYFVFRYQLILFVTTLMVLSFLLSIPFFGQEKIDYTFVHGQEKGPYAQGEKAPATIFAPRKLEYIHKDKTRFLLQEVKENSPRIFVRDKGLLTENLQVLREAFLELGKKKYSLKNLSGSGRQEVLKKIRAEKKLRVLHELNGAQLERLQADRPFRKGVLRASAKFLKILFDLYVITAPGSSVTEYYVTDFSLVRNVGYEDEELFKIKSEKVLTTDEMFQTDYFRQLEKTGRENLNRFGRGAPFAIVRDVTLNLILQKPMAYFSPELTERERKARLARVEKVKETIQAGEALVWKGERITRQMLWKFEAYNQSLRNTNVTSILSILLLQMIFAYVIILIFRRYASTRIRSISAHTIIFSLLWLMAVGTFLLGLWYYGETRFQFGPDGPDMKISEVFYLGLFAPASVFTILLAVIFGETIAFAMGTYLAFYVLVASKFDPYSFILAFCASMVVAFTSANISKRIQFFKAGIYIFLVHTVVLAAAYLQEEKDLNLLLYVLPVNLGVSMTWVLFAAGLLTLYESIFNIPTVFRLLELADSSNPLIQQVITRAPSTWQHTLMVANLSEAAARAIGGNPLLTRVGVYYHDIGKTVNAGFYVENQHLIPKPEYTREMSPEQAARKIIDHVLDGIVMARSARLPQAVMDFIPEHHGTSTMAYFYHKALAENRQKGEIKRADFRYPGPIPQSRETGIVMIADSVEAASRTLEEPTREQLKELLQRIINIKMAEDQLVESRLTLGDLEKIKEAFLDVLMSAGHSRPVYPSQKSIAKLEQGEEKNGPASPARKNMSSAKPAARTEKKATGKSEGAKPAVKKAASKKSGGKKAKSKNTTRSKTGRKASKPVDKKDS